MDAAADPTRRALLAALAGGAGLALATEPQRATGKKSKAGKKPKPKPALATAVVRVVASDIGVDDGNLVFVFDLRIDAAELAPQGAIGAGAPLLARVPIGPAAAVRAGIVRAAQERIGELAGLAPGRIDVVLL
jgi:hypothetical protein